MGKVCNDCGAKKRSEEWTLSGELAKSNKRLFIVILVLLVCWFLTIVGAVTGVMWFLDNYEITTETITLDGDGTNNYVGSDNGGIVYYGDASEG